MEGGVEGAPWEMSVGRGQQGEQGKGYGIEEKQNWIQVGCLALHDVLTHVITSLLVASVSLSTKQGMAVSSLQTDTDSMRIFTR